MIVPLTNISIGRHKRRTVSDFKKKELVVEALRTALLCLLMAFILFYFFILSVFIF
jgi:hypothetical protein